MKIAQRRRQQNRTCPPSILHPPQFRHHAAVPGAGSVPMRMSAGTVHEQLRRRACPPRTPPPWQRPLGSARRAGDPHKTYSNTNPGSTAAPRRKAARCASIPTPLFARRYVQRRPPLSVAFELTPTQLTHRGQIRPVWCRPFEKVFCPARSFAPSARSLPRYSWWPLFAPSRRTLRRARGPCPRLDLGGFGSSELGEASLSMPAKNSSGVLVHRPALDIAGLNLGASVTEPATAVSPIAAVTFSGTGN